MKQPSRYNTALYMRLSRDDENYGDSVSIETQRTILRQFAADNGLQVYDEYGRAGLSLN
ncbi:MAG: recombinase [Lachnospiraceae bacterium]|nr:recombinase [Lachnospiraceae bacterium]